MVQKKAWKVVFTLAFFGCKRISEYSNDLKRGISIMIAQLEFDYELENRKWKESESFILNRRTGKTAQLGRDLYATYVCTCNDKICAVCTMKDYLKERLKHCTRTELVRQELFPEGRAFNKYQVGATLRKAAKIAKIENKVLKSHGFRKGGAQMMIEKGVPQEAIKKQGDWQNADSIRPYANNMERQQSKRIWKKYLNKR